MKSRMEELCKVCGRNHIQGTDAAQQLVPRLSRTHAEIAFGYLKINIVLYAVMVLFVNASKT